MIPSLRDHLAAALAGRPESKLCVAFSGGPDSTALLHALAQLPAARKRGLRALHVDHGLHPDSARWAVRCRQFATGVGLECTVLHACVDGHSGEGLEAAARRARYDALAAQLEPGEWLVLAHHRDDQIETVLLKLLRGAGPEGLGGMRALRAFHAGQLWRPLLALPRTLLHHYIAEQELPTIDDPSNRNLSLARNRLRHEVLPHLLAHWPQAGDSITQSAALCRDAADSLRQRWLAALNALRDPLSDSLDVSGWLALEPALRHPLLDCWLHGRGFNAPTTAQRRQIERQCQTRDGRVPCVSWSGTEVHVWRGRLWADSPAPDLPDDWAAPWRGEALTLPDHSLLTLEPPAGPLGMGLTVRLRRGGERIRPAGDRHTRELRDLYQQAGIPPWRRACVPLLFIDHELVAVADRWISDRGMTLFDQVGARPRWHVLRRDETQHP